MKEQAQLVLALCVLLASMETLQGIFRAAILVPRFGKKASLQVSFLIGALLAFLGCYWFVPKIGWQTPQALFTLGILLAAFMAAFDVFIGRRVMRLRWARILSDFNPVHGNYLTVALVLLIFYPSLVMVIKPWF